MGLKLAAALLVALAPSASALAAPATCRDYTQAKGADRALIDGFIAARLEGRPAAEVDAKTLKIRDLATGFCADHPTSGRST